MPRYTLHLVSGSEDSKFSADGRRVRTRASVLLKHPFDIMHDQHERPSKEVFERISRTILRSRTVPENATHVLISGDNNFSLELPLGEAKRPYKRKPLTEEQKAAKAEILKKAREKRAEKRSQEKVSR